MTRPEIPVRFADLRRLAREVPMYMADLAGTQDEPWTLRTAVEDDWGLAGLDTEELLLAFGETYQVDLEQFDFTGFISPEGFENIPSWQAILLPAVLFLGLLLWLIKTAVAGLCWLVSRLWPSVLYPTIFPKSTIA